MNVIKHEQAADQSVLFRRLRALQDRGIIRPDDSFLVVFGSGYDLEILRALGYDHVTLANIEPSELTAAEAAAQMNASIRLDYPDASFDHVVAHAGLHHASRPHTALCEMYRVARHSAIFFETQDSATMRLATRLGLASRYELNENTLSGGPGGVDGTPIPNHVYRWTPNEVEKLVRSLDPTHEPRLLVYREWDLLEHARRALDRTLPSWVPVRLRRRLGGALVKTLNRAAGHQGNSMAVCIHKAYRPLLPWLTQTAEVVELAPALRRAPPAQRKAAHSRAG